MNNPHLHCYKWGIISLLTKHVLHNLSISLVLINEVSFNIDVGHFHCIVYVVQSRVNNVFVYAYFVESDSSP